MFCLTQINAKAAQQARADRTYFVAKPKRLCVGPGDQEAEIPKWLELLIERVAAPEPHWWLRARPRAEERRKEDARDDRQRVRVVPCLVICGIPVCVGDPEDLRIASGQQGRQVGNEETLDGLACQR